MRGAHRLRALARSAAARLAHARERAQRLASRAVAPGANRTHILMTGYPRTGSSLLYNMLAACLADFEFDAGEVRATQTLWRWANRVSKRPFDLFDLDDIVRANTLGKRLIVLLTVRDLRDIVTSVHSHMPDDYLIGYESCYHVDGTYPNYSVRSSDRGLRDFYQAFERCRARSDVETATVRYEDLIADPGSVQQRLAEQLGLRFTLPFEEYHQRPERHAIRFEGSRRPLAPELVKFHDPVSRDYVGRWASAEHRARIEQQFGTHPELLEMLRTHGYEKDDAWFAPYEDAP